MRMDRGRCEVVEEVLADISKTPVNSRAQCMPERAMEQRTNV